MRTYKKGQLVIATPDYNLKNGKSPPHWLARIIQIRAGHFEQGGFYMIKIIKLIDGLDKSPIPDGVFGFTGDHLEPYIKLTPNTNKMFKNILKNM